LVEPFLTFFVSVFFFLDFFTFLDFLNQGT